jgi:hypothetical protein
MPAALYPTKRQMPKSRFSFRDEVYTDPQEEIRDYLLCGECEGLFSAKSVSKKSENKMLDICSGMRYEKEWKSDLRIPLM